MFNNLYFGNDINEGDNIKRFRSDFADELLDDIIENKDYRLIKKKKHNIITTHVEVLRRCSAINKDKGNYFSIEFNKINEETSQDEIIQSLIDCLSTIHPVNSKDKILIVGLGNNNIIADSLGPSVADKILVTNHLFKLMPDKIDDNIKKVCVFTPKVMGQTGLESSDLIKAISDLFQPSLVIVIDSLASNSITRINKVIQINDYGIAPGSGIGNFRKAVNRKFLNVPIIAIGVATVVMARQIIEESLQNFQNSSDKTSQKTINKILKSIKTNMVVTPKEIDEEINLLAHVIANAINNYIHN